MGKRPVRFSILLFLIAGFSFIFLSDPASSYVLRGPHILELMVEKMGMPVDAVLIQKLIIYPAVSEDPDLETVVLNEKTRYIFPDKFRSDISTDETHRIQIVSGDQSLTILDGKKQGHRETFFDYYKDLLLYRVRTMIQDRLSFLGVDVEASCYNRFEDKIYFVIGSDDSGSHVPQIWVDKDTFLPFRFILDFTYLDEEVLFTEVRYRNWKKIKNTWIPMTINFIKGSEIVRQIEVVEAEVNSKLDTSYFDFSLVESEYVNSSAEGNSQTDIMDVQKKVDDFGKIIE